MKTAYIMMSVYPPAADGRAYEDRKISQAAKVDYETDEERDALTARTLVALSAWAARKIAELDLKDAPNAG